MSRRMVLRGALVLLLLVNTWSAVGRIGFFINRHLGERALAEARLDQSLGYLRASLWWQPQNAPGHVLMGRAVHLALANGLPLAAWPGAPPEELLAAASLLVAEGIALSPADAWSWFNLAEVYRNYQLGESRRQRLLAPIQDGAGETPAAVGMQPGDLVIIAASLRAQALEPSFFFYRDFLGLLYLRRGLDDAAAAEFQESFRLMPLHSAHGSLTADILRSMAAAVEAGMESAAESPHVTPAIMARSRAELFQVLERDEDAIMAWKALAALVGPQVQIECNYQQARLYQGLGLYRESLPLLRANVEEGGGGSWRPGSLLLLARGLSEVGDHEGALRVLEDYRDALPDSFRPIIYMAREHQLMGDLDEAGRLYRAAARRFPGESGAWHRYIDFLRQQGRTEEALQQAEEYVRRLPQDETAKELLRHVQGEAGS